MLGRLYAKVASWVLYNLFLWASRNCDFATFQLIWNRSYQARLEAEWIKVASAMNSGDTNPQQVKLGVAAAQKPSVPQYGPTYKRPGRNDGLLN